MINKKIKYILYAVIVLWMVTFSQMMIDKVFAKNGEITQAFSSTNTDINESCLDVTGVLNSPISDEQKKLLISDIANKLGIQENSVIEKTEKDGILQMRMLKDGKYANTKIAILKTNDKEFIHITLTLYDKPESAVYYKNILDDYMKELQLSDYQVNLRFSSLLKGKLSKEEKNELVNSFLKSLNATSVYESKQNGIYTNYAYTPLISKSFVCNKKKINITIAITYDESAKQSKIYLATPILNEDF